MTTGTRNLIIAVIAGLAAIIAALTLYLNSNGGDSIDSGVVALPDSGIKAVDAKPIDAAKPDAAKPLDASKPVDALKLVDAAKPAPDAFVWKDAAVTPPKPDAAVIPPVTGIGSWVDSPGACPQGTTQVTLTTSAQLLAASRGQNTVKGPGTCYFIKNGTYQGTIVTEFNVGGSPTSPIYFIGESRTGVVLKGQGWWNASGSNVIVRNLTYSIVGLTMPTSSWSTLTIDGPTNVMMDHVTMTGDCKAGGVGGQIELLHINNVTLDSMIIENFGSCLDNKWAGRDQGLYIESGSGIAVRNSVIRGNSSRGIQLYTGDGAYGTLSNIVIEKNRIYSNGHNSYQDGMVLIGSGGAPGLLSNLTIKNNLIYDNYFSGIRVFGPDTAGILIANNTFVSNGVKASRSAVFIDDATSGANITFTKNIFVTGPTLLNVCSSATGFFIKDNIVFGMVNSPTMSCITTTKALDPQLDASMVPQNPLAVGYGAYSN